MSSPQLNDLPYSYLGRVDYERGLELQRELLEARQKGAIGDFVLMLEHPSVYTLGRRGVTEDIIADAEELQALGVKVFEVNRGGQATYHGPGQLVAYPILDMRQSGLSPSSYVRGLEGAILRVLEGYGITAFRRPKRPGIYTGSLDEPRKIAAIGVKVSGGVTTHGLALNVTTDLSYFERIVPCGMAGLSSSSIASESGLEPTLEEVAERLASALGEELGRVPIPRSLSFDCATLRSGTGE